MTDCAPLIEILRVHLKGEILEDVDLAQIAQRSNNYSGSDLKNLAVSAALEALKDSIPEMWGSKKTTSDGATEAKSSKRKNDGGQVAMQDRTRQRHHSSSLLTS